MEYAFILNPFSGRKKDSSFFAELIASFCRGKKIDYFLQETQRAGQGKILAEEALQKGAQCVVAVGGDGTINEIARALLYTQVPLGIIPKGSANGLAREFGIPLNPRKALESLLYSRELSIEVGKMNDEPFFSVAGLGFDARVGYAYNCAQKGGRQGKLPYFTVGTKEYLSYKPSALKLYCGDTERRLTPFLVAIANSKQYGIGARIAPRAVVNDGFLTLSIVHPAPWHRYLWHLPRVFTGSIDRAPFLETLLAKELKIVPEKEVPYHIDGEYQGVGRNWVVKVEAGAIRALVPGGYIP